MTDIVARLREYGMNAPTGFRVYHDAANEIERLRAELAAQADIHTELQMRLSAERDKLRENNASLNKHLARARGNTKAMKAERDELRALLREARNIMPRDWAFWSRIDAALKASPDESS